jgi:L-asparaginase
MSFSSLVTPNLKNCSGFTRHRGLELAPPQASFSHPASAAFKPVVEERPVTIDSRSPESPIVVITTGGTIDKTYFDALSQYQVGESVVRRLLDIGRVAYPFQIIELFRKDSLDLTDADREVVRAKVAELTTNRIIITHGTDTMTDTARVLAGIADKTIVFTGSLSPARFSESDATFNLGMAFATVQTAGPGVYIAMSGQVFRADRVRKDRAAGRFVPLP